MANPLDNIMGELFGEKKAELEYRAPSGVKLDTTLQPRAEMDMELVEDYAERMHYLVSGELVHVSEVKAKGLEPDSWDVYDQHGEKWEPAKAVRLKDNTVLVWDGHHRTQAARQSDALRFPYLIEDGNKEDAFRLSLGANYKHGKRRTREDKRRAAYKALIHPELKKFSDSMIADITKLTQTFVSSVRRELEATPDYQSPEVRIDRTGREFRPDNIGAKAKAGPPAGSARKRKKSGEVVDLPTNQDTRQATKSDDAAAAPASGSQIDLMEDVEPGDMPTLRIGDFRDHLERQPNASVDVLLTRGSGNVQALGAWRQLAHIADRVVADEGYVLPFLLPDWQMAQSVIGAFESGDFECAWLLTVHLSGTADRDNRHGLPSTSLLVPVLVREGHELPDTLIDSYSTQRSPMGLREVVKLIIGGLEAQGLAVDPMAGDGGLAAGARAAGLEVIAIDKDESAIKSTRKLIGGK